jgi:ribonucleotide reductase beta subunit family protein with ferritin-like domain
MNGAANQIIFAPQGRSWASSEQRQEASHSFSYKVWFILRLQPSKRDEYTSTRQTPQQEEVQEWHRSAFWLRLVTRRKLLAALQLSVASHIQM